MWFRDGGDGDGLDPSAGKAPPDLTRRQAKQAAAAAGPPARRGNMAPPRHGRPRPWPGRRHLNSVPSQIPISSSGGDARTCARVDRVG